MIFGGNYIVISSALPQYSKLEHFINMFVMMIIMTMPVPIAIGPFFIMIPALVAGDDKRQKLEFHHIHLELGALGYIETFLFYWSWGFFPKKNPPRPIFVFENTRAPLWI